MAIIDRLENWKNWVRVARFSPSSCKSLESKYKSPEVWQGTSNSKVIDLLDALKVERAIISLPRIEMNIIVYAYLRSGYNFDAFCAKNKIKGDKLVTKSDKFMIEQLKIESKLNLILHSIDNENKKAYKRDNNLTPSTKVAVNSA